MMHTHTEHAGNAPGKPLTGPSLQATISPSSGPAGTKIRIKGEDVTTRIHEVGFLLNEYRKTASVIHVAKGELETTVPADAPRNGVFNVVALDLNDHELGLLGHFHIP